MPRNVQQSFDTVPFTLRDIREYKTKYIGSKLERSDIKKAYMKYKGSMSYMATEILFMDRESFPRIKNIIDQMIRAGEIPLYKAFSEEDDGILRVTPPKQTLRKSPNKCRDLVRYKGASTSHPRYTDRLAAGTSNMLKKYKPKKRIPKKYLRPKAVAASKAKAITDGGSSPENQSLFKSFVGGIVKGMFK